MKNYNYLLLALCLSLTFTNIEAQVSFTDMTDEIMQMQNYSGVAIAILDMNGDSNDDIVRLSQGTDLFIDYQSSDGSPFEMVEIGKASNSSEWSMCVGDVNNDGINEVFSGGIGEEIEILTTDFNAASYIMDTLPGGTNIFVQGSNFVDINNDGLLDIFACHDNAASYIWANNGDGTFRKEDTWIDFSIDGSFGEPASGNYGSIWADIDNDGDLDLYIAKCRQGVTDVTDHRRINKLYLNNGDGTFVEDSESRGLDIEWQSWTADFQDVNNDGFLDLFITNHDHPAQLLLNDGAGNFTEVENTGINVTGLPIQGVMRDFDNDGWVDILVAGRTGQLFINNRDNTFTEIFDLFDANNMESFALGDLNSDGYVDIYGGYANVYTTPSNVNDKVWINNGGDNNHFAVHLRGTISNINGIGAWVEIYGDWGKQVREVRSGESYGIMNSTTQYFGLGDAESIDSMIIKWPSGLEQTEYELSTNSKVTILEGGCLAEAPEISIAGNLTFCSGDSVVLSAPVGLASYAWSNGATASSIVVYESGNYSVNIENEEGCTGFSESFTVVVDPAINPMIAIDGDNTICDGETVTITYQNDSGSDFIWSTGDSSQFITVATSGIYSVGAEGLCGIFQSNAVEVIVEALPDAPVTTDAIIEIGEVAILTAEGNNIVWYENEDTPDDQFFAKGNLLEVSGVETDRQYFAADRLGSVGEESSVGMIDHAGSLYSGAQNRNNLLIFDALANFSLDSVKVYTDVAGVRKMLLFNSDDVLLDEVLIDVPVGESYVFVGLAIPAGNNMYVTTDEDTNVSNIGQVSPRLQRSSENVSYPYVVDDVVILKNSNFGSDWYYYFYDWKISTDTGRCPGERSVAEVIIETVSADDISLSESIRLFPNPVAKTLTVDLDERFSFPAQISFSNALGQTILKNVLRSSGDSIDVSLLQNGVYYVVVKTGSAEVTKRIIVSH